jgi:predicted nicotinamide N-methyase
VTDELLHGARIDYRLRRIAEAAGELVLALDVIASLDAALDDLVRLGEVGVPGDEILRLTPYFGVLWPSGRGLARWIGEHPTWLEGQTVLELGCGLALPSLVAARLGARAVALDCHPDVPSFLARNTALAGVEVEYRSLDWRAPEQLARLCEELGGVDLVIGSDLLYEAELAVSLPAALARVIGGGQRFLLADPGRPHLQGAVQAMEARGFVSRLEVRSVPGTLDHAIAGPQGGGIQELYLLEFTREATA